MYAPQPNNPLHGITLEKMLTELVTFYGWQAMGQQIDIRCFTQDPSIGSSLKFLRRTPWARERVEALYVAMRNQDATHADQRSIHRLTP
jgi:uncharacterized protein (DUF2132 family)